MSKGCTELERLSDLIIVSMHVVYLGETIINTDAGLYYNSAKALFLPVKPIPAMDGFELNLHKHRYFFYNNDTPFNASSSAFIAMDKYCTNTVLAMANIPVPKGVLFQDSDLEKEPLENIIADLRFPLVIKPVHGSLGEGVLCNIQNITDLSFFLKKYSAIYSSMIIEEFYGRLQSYRVLVFNGRVIGVVLCHPAQVAGDGLHTIAELIELTNAKRKEMSDYLGPIVLDEEAHMCLTEQGLDQRYVPSSGEVIALGYTSNPTRGGSYETVDINICQENRNIMTKVAEVLHLGLTGIDVQCTDINTPISQSLGVILEVNHRPSMLIHEHPVQGRPQLVTKKIMRTFIWKHLWSYARFIYSYKPTAFYVRTCMASLVAIAIFGFLYLYYTKYFL